MKKLITIVLFSFFTASTNTVQAQVTKEIKKDAKTVGNKTAEISSKAASKIKDKTYADKVGPNGQTIYIDKHSHYYWVDDKGHKEYVKKSQLKNK